MIHHSHAAATADEPTEVKGVAPELATTIRCFFTAPNEAVVIARAADPRSGQGGRRHWRRGHVTRRGQTAATLHRAWARR